MFRKIVCSMLVVFLISSQSFAQNANTSTTKSGPKKQLTMIFLTGLGGAVLGLSTLSFYGKPQDHMSNIAAGFALGIIFGTIYVTYSTATRPKEYLSNIQNPLMLNPTSRESIDFKSTPTLATYSFSF